MEDEATTSLKTENSNVEIQEEKDVKMEEENNVKMEEEKNVQVEEEKIVKEPPKYFQCETCGLREKYDFFGKDVPFVKEYQLQEDSYIIEDPFLPPKRGEFLVLGSHCIKCGIGVCKDPNCSFYYSGTYCIVCAKQNAKLFPDVVQNKLNRIVVN